VHFLFDFCDLQLLLDSGSAEKYLWRVGGGIIDGDSFKNVVKLKSICLQKGTLHSLTRDKSINFVQKPKFFACQVCFESVVFENTKIVQKKKKESLISSIDESEMESANNQELKLRKEFHSVCFFVSLAVQVSPLMCHC
jgi:hypothetical protein